MKGTFYKGLERKMECLSRCFKYKVNYNINFWGAKRAEGYVFADDADDARHKLEERYGRVDWNDIKQSTVIGFEISETDFIETNRSK